MTEGVLTRVEEVYPDSFLITDEQIIQGGPDSSRVIASYQDGRRDTVYIQEVQNHHHHSSGSSFFMNYLFFRAISHSMFGYHMGYGAGYAPSAAYYRNRETYNRVNNTTGSTLRRTAVRSSSSTRSSRNVKTTKPKNSSKGFGRSSSSRSYGG